jgi:hypothetical protein
MSTHAQETPVLTTPNPIPTEQRRQLMDTAVNEWAREGWRVESRSEFQAVFAKGHRPNHILHLLLSIVTVGLWIPVWICLSVFSGEKRKVVSVDEYGNRTGR